MKVPVHILLRERSESVGRESRSLYRKSQASARLESQPSKEMDVALTAQSMEDKTEKDISLEGSDQDKMISKIREILREKHPSLEELMDVTLKEEREKQERQNDKVLQILKIKDDLIGELQGKIFSLESNENEGQDNELQKKLQTLEQECKNKEEQSLITLEERDETIKLLNEDLEKIKGGYNKLDEEYKDAQKKIEDLRKREDYVIKLANKQEEFKANYEIQISKKDEIIKQLQEKQTYPKEMENEIRNLKNNKKELEARIKELEGICHSDNDKLAGLIKQINTSKYINKSDLEGEHQLQIQNENLLECNKKFEEELKTTLEEVELLKAENLKMSEELTKIQQKEVISSEIQTLITGDNLDTQNKKIEELKRQNEENTKIIAQLKQTEANSFSISPKSITKQIDGNERLDELEIIIVKLREELIQLTEENNELESKLRELDADYEDRTETELIKAQNELIRFKAIQRLAQVIPSDPEIVSKLNTKLETQQNEIKHLKGLLLRAKVEFDKISQNSEKSEKLGFEQEREHMKVERLSKKLNESLRVIYKLKLEYSSKLRIQQEGFQRKLHKLAAECRDVRRSSKNISEENKNLNDSLTKEMEKAKINMQTIMEQKDQNKDLETQVKNLERKLEELKGEHKNLESNIKDKDKEIEICKNTLQKLQHSNEETLSQQCIKTTVELIGLKEYQAKISLKNNELSGMIQLMRKKEDEDRNLIKKLSDEKNKIVMDKENFEKLAQEQSKELKRLFTNLEDSKNENAEQLCKIMNLENEIKNKNSRTLIDMTKIKQKKMGGTSLIKSSAIHSDEVLELLKQLKEENHSEIVDRLSQIILIADRKIEDLEYSVNELNYRSNFNEDLLYRCELLSAENSNLQSLYEKLTSSKEENAFDRLKKSEDALIQAQHSLHETNCLLLESENKNKSIQVVYKQLQDTLKGKEEEIKIIQAKATKDLNAARNKAEQDMNLRLNFRNEEIKAYFDTQVAKLILGKENGTNTLSISRELCEKCLTIDNLKFQFENSEKDKMSIQSELMEISDQLKKTKIELNKLQNIQNEKIKIRYEEYCEIVKKLSNQTQINENTAFSKWNKIHLKIELDRKNVELSSANMKINRINIENEHLKIEIENANLAKEQTEIKINQIMEEKKQIINEMEENYKKYQVDIQQVQKNLLKNNSNEKKKISDANEKQILQSNLAKENEKLKKNCEKMQESLENMKQKIEILSEANAKNRNESDVYKNALADMQNTIKNISEEGESLDQKNYRRTEQSILKLPKYVSALVKAKQNEAKYEAKCGEYALQLQNEQKSLSVFNAKIHYYENLLKENNISFDNNSRIEQSEVIMKSAEYKQISKDSKEDNDNTHMEELKSCDQDIIDLLIEGVIGLCSELAKSSNKKPSNAINEIDRAQKIVIKSLATTIREQVGESITNLHYKIPQNEKDSKLWYLELAEMQSQRVESAVNLLKELTSKVEVNSFESCASAAQAKATAIELTSVTQQVSEEAANLKIACMFVRKDLEGMGAGDRSRYTRIDNEAELMDRLALSEKIKKSLENEVVQLKLALSYDQTMSKQHIENSRSENEKFIQQTKEQEMELSKIEQQKSEIEKTLILEKKMKEKMESELNANQKKLKELSVLLEKQKNVTTKKESEKKEIETLKVSLSDKCDSLMKENRELKLKCNMLEHQLETSHEQGTKALQNENKELENKLKLEISERKKEIEFWIKERAQMHQLIDTLKCEKEALNKELEELKNTGSQDENTKSKEFKKKQHKYHAKIKKLKGELEKKESEFQGLEKNSKELIEAEKKKTATLEADLKEAQIKIKKIGLDLEKTEAKSTETLATEAKKCSVKFEEIAKEREFEIKEKARAEERFKSEMNKMSNKIEELNKILNKNQCEFDEEKQKYKILLDEKTKQIKEKTNQLESIIQKEKLSTEQIKKYDTEINEIKKNLTTTQNGKEEIDQSHKELEHVVLSQEDVIKGLKQDIENKEKEFAEKIDHLNKANQAQKKSADDAIALYETQIKLLKEKFKVEYIELNKKLAIKTQGKGNIPSPKVKDDNNELSIQLMFQLTEKDSQIKILEREVAKMKNKKASTTKKLQPKDINTQENNPEVSNKTYSELLAEKAELESQVGKLQSILFKTYHLIGSNKELELRVTIEKEKNDDYDKQNEELKQEIEKLKEAGKLEKKVQGETLKKYKNDLQKTVEDLNTVKSSSISPETLEKNREEKRDLENKIKQMREELQRKNELMKQWKEKEDQLQSLTEKQKTEIDLIKEENEKIKKNMKEAARKDQTIKSLKMSLDSCKSQDNHWEIENKNLNEKLKTMKTDITRKEELLKSMKDKTEEIKMCKEEIKEKSLEIERISQKLNL